MMGTHSSSNMHSFVWGPAQLTFLWLVQYSTYQLSFAQLESNVCEATQTIIHRLPLGFRNEVPPTCAGHHGLASTHAKVIQTGTRKRTSETDARFRPSQCEWWKVWIKGVIHNCFTPICRVKQRLVGWIYVQLFGLSIDYTYRIFPYWRPL